MDSCYTNNRDQFWDIVKGIAIILMILGHSIQCGQGAEFFHNSQCYNNILFKLIYGFHMPLFSFVSGFFFYNSIQKRNLVQLTKKLFFQLVIPLISFGILLFIFEGDNGNVSGFIPFSIKLFKYILNSLWFLTAILYSSLCLGICNKLRIDSLWMQMVIIVALCCVPDAYNSVGFKFLYPFFLLGYYFRKFDLINSSQPKRLTIGIISTIIYLVMMFTLYQKCTYIYTSHIYIFQGDGILFHVYNDTLRYIVGFLGIIGMVFPLKYLSNTCKISKINCAIADIGRKSMGIYCFQDLIVRHIPQFTPLLPIITIIGTFIFLLLFSYVLTTICGKNKYLDFIFLGGRSNKQRDCHCSHGLY